MPKLTKRLTENEKGFYSLVAPELMNFITRRGQEEYLSKLRSAAISKLGQLEDVEEKLGIDLITLFKALTDGFYARREGDLSKIDLYDVVRLGIYHGRFVFYGFSSAKMRMIMVCVADKDRWAITKEELE